MPHLSGFCACGRRIHWPRNARYGDTWTCRRCRAVWTLCREGGNPMSTARSLPPPPQSPGLGAVRQTAAPPYQQAAPRPLGCGTFLLGIAVLVVWWLTAAVS
jgi:hypothetical protein